MGGDGVADVLIHGPGGNQVSLRPEYTSSMVRSLIERERLPALPQYAGPVFWYSDDARAYRQFNQAGVELIGLWEPKVDSNTPGTSLFSITAPDDWLTV